MRLSSGEKEQAWKKHMENQLNNIRFRNAILLVQETQTVASENFMI